MSKHYNEAEWSGYAMVDFTINVTQSVGRAAIVTETDAGINWLYDNFGQDTFCGRTYHYIEEAQVAGICKQMGDKGLTFEVKYV